MERIDPKTAAQVWQRVLAGRDALGYADRVEASLHPEHAGDLPPVRSMPPGIAGWKTYDVFSGQKQRQSKQGRTFPSPFLALLFALLVKNPNRF